MKFSVNSKALLERLNAAGKAINKKTPIRALEYFHFALKNGMLHITASDSENMVTTTLAVEGYEGDGSFCILAKRVTALVKAMPNCSVSFVVNNDCTSVDISYVNGKFNVSGIPSKDYPMGAVQAKGDISATFTVPSAVVAKACNGIAFAMSPLTVRPILNGMFWDVRPESLTFAASDTHVLAKYRDHSVQSGVTADFIQPPRSIQLLEAFLPQCADLIVTVSERSIVFRSQDFQIISARIVGKFPNYDRVFPAEYPINLKVERNALLDAVSRVNLCTERPEPILRLTVSLGQLNVAVQDSDFGAEGVEFIPVDYSGAPLTIGLNADNIKEILDAMQCQNVILHLIENSRPAVFTPVDSDEKEEIALLCMPMVLPV